MKKATDGDARAMGQVAGAVAIVAVTHQATKASAGSVSASVGETASAEVNSASKAPVTNELHKRPNNATTVAQRESVQGQPCVDCGGTSVPMVADHKTPLVQEHYETGTINTKIMRSLEVVQP